jgi:DNA-binding response OmpR family regulator
MPRIICIDPDAGSSEQPVEVLRSAGYEVMLAFTADIGLALVRLFTPDIILLHCDLAETLMPQIRQACPTAPVLLTGDRLVSVEQLESIAAHGGVGTLLQDARHLH